MITLRPPAQRRPGRAGDDAPAGRERGAHSRQLERRLTATRPPRGRFWCTTPDRWPRVTLRCGHKRVAGTVGLATPMPAAIAAQLAPLAGALRPDKVVARLLTSSASCHDDQFLSKGRARCRPINWGPHGIDPAATATRATRPAAPGTAPRPYRQAATANATIAKTSGAATAAPRQVSSHQATGPLRCFVRSIRACNSLNSARRSFKMSHPNSGR